MELILICGLPRSSSLGVADLLARSLDHKCVHVHGHLHAAAALDCRDIAIYDSPLGLYEGSESLLRCLLKLNEIPDNIDARFSIKNYYFNSQSGLINSERFIDLLRQKNALLVDPSFSHSIDTQLLTLPLSFGLSTIIFVVWRNPIFFCMDLMHGVYGLDSCLQWILWNQQYSFPLDPLQIWFDYTSSIYQSIKLFSSTSNNVLCCHFENFTLEGVQDFANTIPLKSKLYMSPSGLEDVFSYFNDCPYSGDPSYSFTREYCQSLDISFNTLSRFSCDHDLISSTVQLAEALGYRIID